MAWCVPFPICFHANVQLIDFDIPWYQARYIWNSEWSYLYSIHLICMAAKSWTEHTARGQGARTTNPPYNNNTPERIYIQLHLIRDTFVSFFSVVQQFSVNPCLVWYLFDEALYDHFLLADFSNRGTIYPSGNIKAFILNFELIVRSEQNQPFFQQSSSSCKFSRPSHAHCQSVTLLSNMTLQRHFHPSYGRGL